MVQIIINNVADHPLRVAVDGVDAAGKTCFSNELRSILEVRGHTVIQASIDGFHNPQEIRYKKGRENPEGYYYDSFNYRDLIKSLLRPLGPKGNRSYKTRIFDYRNNIHLSNDLQHATEDTILLFDGVFLLRSELNHMWDLRIYLDISFHESLKRGVNRDEGNKQEITKLYRTRYIPGQKLYFKEVNPLKRADIIIRNSKINNPEIFYMKV